SKGGKLRRRSHCGWLRRLKQCVANYPEIENHALALWKGQMAILGANIVSFMGPMNLWDR
ncbi:hypothetical protein R0J90_18110, partial [Micrococcus sp. SIMBA_144]